MQLTVDNDVISTAISAVLAGWHPTKTFKDYGWLYAKENLATLVLVGELDVAEIDFPVKIDTPGKFSIALRKLLTGIDNSRGKETIIHAIPGLNGMGQLRIKSARWLWDSRMVLDILQPKRWLEPKKSITIDSAKLRGILSRAIRGMIPDDTGSVQFLQLHASKNKLEAVGACNYKMAAGSTIDTNIDINASSYIGHKMFGRVTAILKQLDGPIELGFDEGFFSIRADGFRYSLTGPAEKIPSFLNHFNKTTSGSLAKVSGTDLRMGLQAISIAIDNQFGGYIDFKILSDQIRIQAKDNEESRVIIEAKADKEMTFCFKHEHLMAILVGATEINIEYFDKESNPTYWTHVGDELGAQFILAPARR